MSPEPLRKRDAETLAKILGLTCVQQHGLEGAFGGSEENI
jgi:hypothetical protein